MKLVPNSGTDRVIDLVRPHLKPDSQMGCVTPSFSLFAFAELRDALAKLERVELILPTGDDALEFLGGGGDRANRNQLQARWLANQCADWLTSKVDLRRVNGRVPQGTVVMRDAQGTAEQVVMGSFAFSTDGLGLTPGNPLNLIQASESGAEAAQLAQWFDHQWNGLRTQPESRDALIAALRQMGAHRAPFTLYAGILNHLFGNRDDEMDEERIVKSATGIRNTIVWKKLFKFQRDGVVGAIDKLARFGGCIIADSVGVSSFSVQ